MEKFEVQSSIQGQVTSILDGNTFTLRLGKESAREMKILEQIVTVKIAGKSHFDTNTLGGTIAKLELEKRLAGQRVRCEIVQQNASRGFVANIDFKHLDQGLALYA